MSELFSIHLQNRQQQGRDGVWLDLPTTTEQVQTALLIIGRNSHLPPRCLYLFVSGMQVQPDAIPALLRPILQLDGK